MDPNANLKEQIALAFDIANVEYGDDGDIKPSEIQGLINNADRLAQLVISLDEWIVKGGFLPSRWTRG